MSRLLGSTLGAFILFTVLVAAAPHNIYKRWGSDSPYFSQVQSIRWVDCSTNVPEAMAEQAGLNDTTWSPDLKPIPPNLNCGRLDVPVDYTAPFGAKNNVTIAFTLVKANGTSSGLLLYNPGGPAAEAQSQGWNTAFNLASGIPDQFSAVQDQDILFYDTRGIGGSNRLKCNTTLSQNAPDPSTITTQEDFDALKAANAAFGQSCIDMSTPPGIVGHIGTEEVIRDWNSIRIALGYETFNYIGISYGTWFGAELAYNFPEAQGRFVLDGVAAHGQPDLVQIKTDLKAMNRLLKRADAWCMANSSCPFHGQGKGTVPKLFNEQIINTPSQYSKQLRSQFRTLMTGNPKFAQSNQALADYIESASKNFTDMEVDNGKDAVSSTDLDQVVFPAYVCKDEDIDDPTFEGFQKIAKETTGDDPDMLVSNSFNWAIKLGCVGWPIKGRPKFRLPNNNQMLWVSSDFDLNTPTEQATTARQDTPNGYLVVRHGDNHGTVNLLDQPASKAELAYLENGIPPKDEDHQFITVVIPGETRPPVPDPYSVPVGIRAGDDDPVDSDASLISTSTQNAQPTPSLPSGGTPTAT